MNDPGTDRRGITLLEVLIAIGILAIGLSSVAALITAARSQAGRAVVLDRAAVLAANALADAATFGLLLDGALTVPQASGTSIMIDPAVPSPYLLGSVLRADCRAAGLFSTVNSGTAFAPFQRLFGMSRDDVVVGPGATEDDPPTNRFIDGVPGYEGRMTCMLCLTPPKAASAPGRLSVVVFHGRDLSLVTVTGTITNGVATISATGLLGGRELRDVVRPGVVLWDATNGRFHQAEAAAVASSTSAFLTLSSGTLLMTGTWPVQFLPDSVGLAERPFFPETAGPFTR